MSYLYDYVSSGVNTGKIADVTGGRPDGTEAISGVQTLSRSYSNDAGQVTHSDAYFNLSGLTYSTSTTLGTENTHFYRTRYGYDHRGRQDRVQLPTGTIQRTAYDDLGRAASILKTKFETPGVLVPDLAG